MDSKMNTNSSFVLAKDIFLRDDVNWSFFPSDFDEQQFFDVPSNSCCIVLGTRGMKNLLGDETFRLINEKLLEPNSKERNDFHARFINSLFDSTPGFVVNFQYGEFFSFHCY
eukprot:gb/GECH01010057.1/.p1 GENE.gb/GECH01010057.1/~~gb/GECH01010057.1/.p1  ORF type:complete len:112 (+),score=18.21 gb/GECH01010057.1/:1-336(+)